ncbi:MAG: type II secretion system F family protein [Planctomycetota bacterium]|nr:MAG: type II secretion system F family protein [Planctomycetota bacterium]
MQFVYQARDPNGGIRSGQLVADSLAEASAQLRRMGLHALTLEAEGEASRGGRRRRVRRGDVVYALNQLAVMLDAGVPLSEALQSLAETTPHAGLAQVLRSIEHAVQGGEDLSAALARHEECFDATTIHLLRAAEASGTLPEMLQRIAEQTRADLEIRQKVLGAMMYPAVLLLMCLGVCVFLLAYVFPKLMPIFEGRGLDLPLATKIMMAISNALTQHYWLVLAAVAAIVGSLWWVLKQPWGRARFDVLQLKLPILGTVVRKATLGRCLRTLATTVSAGVPVLEALELAAGVAGNSVFARLWNDAIDDVAAGQQLHEVLRDSPLLPPTTVQMIAAGERSGRLPQVLRKVADFFDSEVHTAIKSATSLIEPLMVAVMGVVVGTIALAMLLPIFKLSTTVH